MCAPITVGDPLAKTAVRLSEDPRAFGIDSEPVPEELRVLFFEEQLTEGLLTTGRSDPTGRQNHHV